VLRRDYSEFGRIAHRQAVGIVTKRKSRFPMFPKPQTLGMRAFLQVSEINRLSVCVAVVLRPPLHAG
jgi:hypothetical protein